MPSNSTNGSRSGDYTSYTWVSETTTTSPQPASVDVHDDIAYNEGMESLPPVMSNDYVDIGATERLDERAQRIGERLSNSLNRIGRDFADANDNIHKFSQMLEKKTGMKLTVNWKQFHSR